MKKENVIMLVAGSIISLALGALFSKKKTPVEVPDTSKDTGLDINRPSGMHYAVFNRSFGNIRNGGRRYAGEITPTGNVYKKFSAWEYGAAAMTAHIQRYINGSMFGKLDTISKILYKYAPPIENNTEGYIAFVVKETRIPKDTVLDWNNKETMWKITKAMSKMESRQATEYYTKEVFEKGFIIAQTQNK